MTEVFSKAVAAAVQNHDGFSWESLSQLERSELIYREMRKIDADSVKRSVVIGPPAGQRAN